MVSDNEFPPLQDDPDVSAIPMEDSMFDPTSHRSVSDTEHPNEAFESERDRRRSNINIDGLEKDLSLEEEEEDSSMGKMNSTKKKKKNRKNPVPSSAPRRLKKKRKVILDDSIELTSEHIREMLRDTSDIVLQNRSHPADYVIPLPDEQDEFQKSVFSIHARKRRRLQHRMGQPDHPSHPSDPENLFKVSYDILLTRPNLSDGGLLAPELLNLWTMNAARLLGKDRLPFRMRRTQTQNGFPVQSATTNMMDKESHSIQEEDDEEQEEEDMEATRRKNGHNGHLDDDDNRFSFPHNEPLEDEEDYRDNHHPYQPDDDVGYPTVSSPLEMSSDNHVGMDSELPPFSDDAVRLGNSEQSPASQGDFSLGAVNDLEDDFGIDAEEESRALDESGEFSMARTRSKWHKHTVKVLSMLKKNMRDSHDTSMNEGDDEKEEKPKSLSYNVITHAASRRTAVGVFFELLQLKTWDFIELEQNESYGDIKIKAGPRFLEDAPSTV